MEEREKERDKRIFTCICCVFILAVSIPLFIHSVTVKYPRSITQPFKPLYFPAMMLGFIIVVCTALLPINIVKLVKGRKDRIKAGESIKKFIIATPNAIIVMAATIIFALAWKVIGFTLSTAIFVTLVSKKLEPERSWKQVILVGIGTALAVYFLFVLVFKVPFPDRIMGPIMDLILYS